MAGCWEFEIAKPLNMETRGLHRVFLGGGNKEDSDKKLTNNRYLSRRVDNAVLTVKKRKEPETNQRSRYVRSS